MALRDIIPPSNIQSIESAKARFRKERAEFDMMQSAKNIRRNTNKYTYIQDYENQQQAFWGSLVRNKDIYNYDDFFHAMSNHPAVYAVVNKIVENMFKGGVEIVPRDGIDNPNQKQYNELHQYMKFVHPDGYTFCEIMRDAWSDTEACGTKLVQIDTQYPFLYGNLDFGQFRANLKENGLFNEGWKWEQIIFGQVVARLGQKEFIWYRLPGKHTLVYPRSPLEPALLGIETDLFGKNFNKNRFTNSSTFGNVIVLPERADDVDAEELSKYIEQNYVSASNSFGEVTTDNAYKQLVLYGGAKIDQSVTDRFKDIDFVQLRTVTIKDICMVYNMPLRVMGIEEAGLGQAGANDTAMRQFYEDLIIPRQKIWEDQTNQQLLVQRLGVTDWCLQLKRPKWINEKDFTNVAIDLKKEGIQTDMEARFQLKEIYPHLNFGFNKGIELQDWDESEDEMNEEIKESEQDQEQEEKKPESEEEERMRAVTRAAEVVRKSWNYRMVENDLDEGEEALQEEFNAISDKMFKDGVKQSVKAWRNNEMMFRVKMKHKAEMDTLLRKESAKIFEAGRQDIKTQGGKRFARAVNLDTENKYKQLVKKESKQASEKWYTDLETMIDMEYNQAIKLKLSENEFIARMQEGFEKKMSKAPAIVRTMTTGFYNEGRMQMIYEAGDFVTYVQYSAILDDRTTDRCSRLDGQIMRTESNIEKILPPLHYNCRSVILPITTEDIKEKTGTQYKATPNNKINQILISTPGFERV